jgi:hypothetical protein
MGVYGMNLAGKNGEKLFSFARSFIEEIPEVRKSLPPIISDIIDDRREPEYSSELLITVQPAKSLKDQGKASAVIQVANKGNGVVSLLSMRIVLLDNSDNILGEFNEWIVTPFAVEEDWPGPLMPNSNRFFSSKGKTSVPYSDPSLLKAEYEVTDIRIWNSEKTTESTDDTDEDITNTDEPSTTADN